MSEQCFEDLKNEIDHCMSRLNELQENLEDLQSKALTCENAFEGVTGNIESVKENNDGIFETLKEIIEQAEMADYGMKRWRTLETKQDLIAAIKKEVLDVV